MIGTKSRRPRWRFSLPPHGKRSAHAPISAAARVTKFPLIVFIHVAHDAADSAFLPWAPLPSLRRHAAAGAHFHKLARPSATARLRSHHEQQLLHSGLAWLGDQGVKASSCSTTLSTATMSATAVLSSFVLLPLVPDELGVAALRPSLGCGHLHAAIGAAPPLSNLNKRVRGQ